MKTAWIIAILIMVVGGILAVIGGTNIRRAQGIRDRNAYVGVWVDEKNPEEIRTLYADGQALLQVIRSWGTERAHFVWEFQGDNITAWNNEQQRLQNSNGCVWRLEPGGKRIRVLDKRGHYFLHRQGDAPEHPVEWVSGTSRNRTESPQPTTTSTDSGRFAATWYSSMGVAGTKIILNADGTGEYEYDKFHWTSSGIDYVARLDSTDKVYFKGNLTPEGKLFVDFGEDDASFTMERVR